MRLAVTTTAEGWTSSPLDPSTRRPRWRRRGLFVCVASRHTQTRTGDGRIWEGHDVSHPTVQRHQDGERGGAHLHGRRRHLRGAVRIARRDRREPAATSSRAVPSKRSHRRRPRPRGCRARRRPRRRSHPPGSHPRPSVALAASRPVLGRVTAAVRLRAAAATRRLDGGIADDLGPARPWRRGLARLERQQDQPAHHGHHHHEQHNDDEDRATPRRTALIAPARAVERHVEIFIGALRPVKSRRPLR